MSYLKAYWKPLILVLTLAYVSGAGILIMESKKSSVKAQEEKSKIAEILNFNDRLLNFQEWVSTAEWERKNEHYNKVLNKADEYNKKPPLFKKLFQAGSVEEEAMQIFMAKKKAEDMREELKQIISFTRGPSAWEELLRTEADIRKKRQQAIYDQKERQRQIMEVIGVIVLVLVIGGFLFGLGWIYYQNRGGGIY